MDLARKIPGWMTRNAEGEDHRDKSRTGRSCQGLGHENHQTLDYEETMLVEERRRELMRKEAAELLGIDEENFPEEFCEKWEVCQ